MTQQDATTLAESIIRCGDPHLGAGMILGAILLDRTTFIGVDPRHTISSGTIQVPDAPVTSSGG
jgi:hypothetical protein